MSTPIIASFDMRADLPLDVRSVKATLADRNLITERYEGMVVYVISEQKSYQLVGGVTDNDWKIVTADAVDHLDFVDTPAGSPNVEGRLQWNNVDGTLNLGMDGGNIVLQIGQETLVRVMNDSGGPILNGQPVYVIGADGATGLPKVELAWSLSETVAQNCVGLCTEMIPDGETGYITARGLVRGLDTSALVLGARVFVGATPGELTIAPPDEHAHSIVVGVCTKVSATAGIILCKGITISQPSELTKDLTGFHKTHRSQYSFNDGTREFTIGPINPLVGYDYYQAGNQYFKYADETITITDVEGIHFMYFDGPTLKELVNPSKQDILDAIETVALISQIYWDADNKVAIVHSEERHGFSMDGETHAYLHMVFGPQWFEGMGLNSITLGTGAADIDAKFGVDVGKFLDDDLDLDTPGIDAATGLTVIYRSGAGNDIRSDFNPGFPVLVGGNNRPLYNKSTLGTWTLEETASGKWICYHVFATNDETISYITHPGTVEYPDLLTAQAGALTEITPLRLFYRALEFLPVATLIYEVDDLLGNAVNARIVEATAGGAAYLDWRSTASGSAQSGGGTPDHNDLNGIDGGISGQRYHMSLAQHTVATQAATSLVDGYLDKDDWVTFNAKEGNLGTPAGENYILESSLSAPTVRTWVPKPISMVFPGVGIAVSNGSGWAPSLVDNSTAWNAAQPGSLKLTSLSGLTFASTSFVKMTGANTFALDTATYSLSSHLHTGVYAPVIHNLVDTTNHPVSGLTLGHFMRATSSTTYGFAAASAADVGAEVAGAVAAHELLYVHANIANGQTAFGWGNWASNFGTTAGTITQGNDGRLSIKATLDALNGLVKCNGAGVYSAVTDNSATWNALVTFPGFSADGVATAGKAVQATDTRLSNARTPTSHTIESHTATVTAGQFLKGTGVNTFGWAAHGLTYTDVGAAPTIHNLVDTTNHPVTGLVAGQIMKATAATTYAFGYDTQYNTNTAQLGPGFATDTYLTGSSIAIPNSSLKAKSIYKCRFTMTKSAAGVAPLVITVRFGTNGSTADTARLTFTFVPAQTAHADTASFNIDVIFRSVGSGTTAVIAGRLMATKDNGTANRGHFVTSSYAAQLVSAGFDSTVSNSIIGISYNGGTAYSGTCEIVDTSLENLI